MSIAMTACGEKVDMNEMIAQFGDDGDGKISMEEGSFPYFVENKESFKWLKGDEIEEKIVGTWTIKDKFGDEYEYTFNPDYTGATTYNMVLFNDETETNTNWAIRVDPLYYGTQDREINENNIRMEVREIEENILILYESDTRTGKFADGTVYSYNLEDPYAILYR